MRNTVQKEIIKNALLSLANHPNADEVYAYVHSSHPTISKATVYRVLNGMASGGSAQKFVSENGANFFDHRLDKHYHLKCDRCGKIFDVDIPFMENLNDINSEKFFVSSHQIIFRGICKQCN